MTDPARSPRLPTPSVSSVRVLVADDQEAIREALHLLLKGEGIGMETAASPAEVLTAAGRGGFDCALLDLNYARDTTSGREGLDLLSRLQEIDPALPVVVMTAWGSIGLAVACMRQGARDFIEKPWDNSRLLSVLRTQAELGRALRRNRRLEEENQVLRHPAGPSRLIAASPAMQRVLELIARIGPSEAHVLITGENGTGKGLAATALHAASRQPEQPMITVNMGGIPENLFESELFGHVKGAFTDARTDRAGRFEMADGGTLFLDEIANLPAGLQSKLLRVLETGEYERLGSSKTCRARVRILSATNANLEDEVAAGRFRRDLLFRLNTVELHLPPLRERREDIPPLASHFLAHHSRRYRKETTGFERPAMEALLAHAWPGNVRELDHAVERAVLLSRGPELTVADLMLRPGRDLAIPMDEMSLEEVERLLIRKALDRSGGSVKRAAGLLGLTRSSLYRRLEKYGLA